MKKNLICTIPLLTLFANVSFAQKNDNDVVENVTKATILLPGLAHEHKLGKASTIYIGAYMNIWFSSTSSFYGSNTSTVHVGPALDLSFRNYYNYKRRSDRGKRTEMNSLNYVAPAFIVTSIQKPFSSGSEFVNLFGVVWGMQRNYPGRFSLDLDLGAGYLFNAQGFSNNNSVQPMSELTLGIWLNKKTK